MGALTLGAAALSTSPTSAGPAEPGGFLVQDPGVALLGTLDEPAEEPETLDDRYAELCQALIADLKAFAAWCSSSKLFVERDRAFEAVLHFDPEDFDAHRGLKHKRDRDGKWEVPTDLPESRNYNKALLKTCEKKYRAVVEKFRDAAFAFFDEVLEQDGAAEPIKVAFRERVEGDVLFLSPDDPMLRERRGEVSDGENGWVLAETLAGRRGRDAIKAAVEASMRATSRAAVIEASEEESSWGIVWEAARTAEGVRVLSAQSSAEAEKVAQSCEMAQRFLASLLGLESRYPEGNTIYLLSTAEDRDRFLDACAGFSDEEREERRLLSGCGLPGAGYADWDEEEARRLDGSVRHSVGALLNYEYDLFLDQGWAWEGFGMYLTRQLTGTRLTWYVSSTNEVDPEILDLRSRLGRADVNWTNEAWQLLRAKKFTGFEEFLGRSVDVMTVPDALVAYAFAAFLLEAHGERVPLLLDRLGAGVAGARALPEVLGLPLDVLEERFVRWLGERR